MDDVVVRGFEPQDAQAVAAMIHELAAFHGDRAAAKSSDVLRYASGQHRLSTIWVVLRGGKACGFAATYDWMNYVGGFPVRAIDLFFVRHDERRRGVGRALLAAVARDAEVSACQRMTVGAEADNVGANAFYQREGFEARDVSANRYVISGEALKRLTTD